MSLNVSDAARAKGLTVRRVAAVLPDGSSGYIDYILKRHGRTRHVTLRVTPDGPTVTIPVRGSLKQADRFVSQHADWIVRQQNAMAERAANLAIPLFELRDGGTMLYRGGRALLRFGAARSAVTEIGEGEWEIQLAVPADADPLAVMPVLAAFLKAEAKRVIAAVYAEVSPLAKRLPTRWQLSGAKSRWGVCTAASTIRYSWRLIFVPETSVRYVVAHELAHLIEFNHSPRFYAEVALMDPEWKTHRETLKKYRAEDLPPVS